MPVILFLCHIKSQKCVINHHGGVYTEYQIPRLDCFFRLSGEKGKNEEKNSDNDDFNKSRQIVFKHPASNRIRFNIQSVIIYPIESEKIINYIEDISKEKKNHIKHSFYKDILFIWFSENSLIFRFYISSFNLFSALILIKCIRKDRKYGQFIKPPLQIYYGVNLVINAKRFECR